MPPPDMPPSIQKPQKSGPNAARVCSISVSVYRLLAHGMIAWIGPRKFRYLQGAPCHTTTATTSAATWP